MLAWQFCPGGGRRPGWPPPTGCPPTRIWLGPPYSR
jgi:hypothetical protein